jgi:hypothetical protein
MHILMCMALNKRVQVLMEPSEYQKLESIAVSQSMGVGELLRRAARERYLQHPEARREAARQLTSLGLPNLPDPESTITAAQGTLPS